MAHAPNTEKWGRAKARERYGVSKTGDVNNAPDASKPQKLGDANNLQGPGYDNDTPDIWLRGGGKGGAEGKPSFDHGPVHGKRA